MNRARSIVLLVFGSTTVWLWSACMCALWGKFFGYRPGSFFICISASLLAYATGMAIPGQFFRLVLSLARRFRTSNPRRTSLSQRHSQTFEGHAGKFFGWALVCSAALSLMTSLAVLGLAEIYHAIASRLLLVESLRDIIHWLLFLPAMLPWGIGAAIVCRAQMRYADRTGLGSVTAQNAWLAAAGFASVLAGFALMLNVDPMLPGLLCCVLQLLAGLVMATTLHPAESAPEEMPSASFRIDFGLAASVFFHAVVIAVLWAIEFKCLCLLMGFGFIWGLVVSGIVALAMAVAVWAWSDQRFFQSAKVTAGAAIITAIALAFQFSLMTLVILESPNVPLRILAGFGAIFPAMAAAILFLNGRYRYFKAGGSRHVWFQLILCGGTLGFLLTGFGILAPDTGIVVITLVLSLLASSVLRGLLASRRMGRQFIWLLCGGVVILASGLAMVHSAAKLRRENGIELRCGDSFWAWQNKHSCGYLPINHGLTILGDHFMNVLMTARYDQLSPSDWLIVDDAPPPTGQGALEQCYAMADMSLADLPVWQGIDAYDLNCLLSSKGRRFKGIYYSPVNICIRDAGSLYSSRAFFSLYRMLSSGGIMVIQASAAIADQYLLISLMENALDLPGAFSVASRSEGDYVELLILLRKGSVNSGAVLENGFWFQYGAEEFTRKDLAGPLGLEVLFE